MMYKIESDIPYTEIECVNPGRFAESHTMALRKLNVGDSFFIPGPTYNDVKNLKDKIYASLRYLDRYGEISSHWDYKMTMVIEDDTLGIRIWRTKDWREESKNFVIWEDWYENWPMVCF